MSESGWKNKDMKSMFVKEKFDWQPWLIAAGIWVMYILSNAIYWF